MSPAPAVEVPAEVGSWRARAEWAEARLAAVTAEKVELNARVTELSAQVVALTEQVATLSGILFGASSEKKPFQPHDRDPAAFDDGSMDEGAPAAGDGRRRGQRRGAAGHGRRDYSHLETEERIIDLEPEQHCCPGCGKAFTMAGSEDSEQLDWRIKVMRIVWRRRRYQRSCACRGPVTVAAPV